MADTRGYLTTREVAAELGGLSHQRIYQLADAGDLVGVQDDERVWKFSPESVHELKSRREARKAETVAEREARQARATQQRWELSRRLAAEQARKQEESDERRDLARRFVSAVEAIAKGLSRCKGC